MKILIDADACPVIELTRQIAAEYGVPVLAVATYAHMPKDGEIIAVDSAPEATDMALFRRTETGDLVITSDYGLASLVLAKGARALSPSGLRFTEENIPELLERRYLAKKTRRAGGRQRGPRPRTHADNRAFAEALRRELAGERLRPGECPAASRKFPSPAEKYEGR